MSLDLKTNLPQINFSLVKVRNCRVYSFENFELDSDNLMLYQSGEEISLTPKQVETLLALVERDGEIVRKEALMSRLWGDSSVEESNLIQNIHVLRKVLGKTSNGKPMIETLRRRGYRFNGELNGTQNGGSTSVRTKLRDVRTIDTSEVPHLTKRRRGLVRGSKFLLIGLCVGFVFLVLLQALGIFGSIFAQSQSSGATAMSSSTRDMIGELLVMILIPVGLGWFSGIGLSLFGTGRMVYALFEKEDSRISSAIVERLLAVAVTLVLLAVAIPNLMFSYREAHKARQLNQALIAGRRSIAVLPLKPVNISDRNELYEMGIPASLIQKLSSIRGFLVRQLSATRRYAEIDQDAVVAGRELKVDYVLASNYQFANGRIKVRSQLVHVASENIDETFSVETDSTDLFTAQDLVADDIAKKLLTKFGYDSVEFRQKAGTNNEEAYKLYLMAMNLSEERGVQNVLKSLEYLNKAVELDPNYASAWAAKAWTHADLVSHTDSDQAANYQSSIDAIKKALAIDPNVAEAYSALCQNKNRYEYDAAGAEVACKRALELDSNSAVAHKTYANFLYTRGRFDEALDEIKTAVVLQPISYRNQQMYALTLYFARRFQEAEDRFKRLLELNPNHTYIHGRLVIVLQEEGKESEAFEYLISMLTQQKAENEEIERFKAAYDASGWRGVIAERINSAKAKGGMSNYQLACLYAKLGDKMNAFESLEKAYAERSFQMAVMNVEPQLDSLRGDPRFADLVRRIDGK